MSMQPIPRNELLEKLAAGWTVRRKGWDPKHQLHKDRWNVVATLQEALHCDDWEGGPPEPVWHLLRKHQTFWEAQSILRSFSSAKITRTGLNERYGCKWLTFQNGKLSWDGCNGTVLHLESINATDWEVWACD